MQADPVDQRRLLDLLAIDTEMARHKHQAESLPELAKLAELRGHYQAAADELVAATTAVGDAQDVLDRIEGDLVPARQRLERNQQRVDDGVITDHQALRSMMDEIAHLKGRISDLEDADLEAMQTVEDARVRADQAAQAKTELAARARELMTSRDASLVALKEKMAALVAERAIIAGSIDAALGGLYDKIRERSGVGAGRLQASMCTACGLTLDPVTLQRYNSAPANQVLRCEECDRILVRA